MTAWCCPSLVQLDLAFAAVLMLLGHFSQFLHAALISSSNWRKRCTEYWNHLVLLICLELVGQNSLFTSTFSGPRLNKLENLLVKIFGCTSSSACSSTSSFSSSSKLKNDWITFFQFRSVWLIGTWLEVWQLFCIPSYFVSIFLQEILGEKTFLLSCSH